MSPTARQVNQAWSIARDAFALVVGAFMLIWETVFAKQAQSILVVAGVAALGITGTGIAQRALRSLLTEAAKEKEKVP